MPIPFATMCSTDVLIAIPVKPFSIAKRRLAPILDTAQRRRLGKAVAARVVTTALATGGSVAVVTGDEGVATWGRDLGASIITEPKEGGLNAAAAEAVKVTRHGNLPWVILHADLPILTPEDLLDALDAIPKNGVLLSPSHNGGTSLIGGDRDTFPFAYGSASFRRHFATVARLPHRLLVRPGLALDLDSAHDLAVAGRLPAGRWLEEVVPVSAVPR